LGTGAQILQDLGVRKLRNMGSPAKFLGLAGFDLEVVEVLVGEVGA
jgi:3,4-dihydroxy 2-butanone 4-phosphate synthase/GTP cyclohydrolase II